MKVTTTLGERSNALGEKTQKPQSLDQGFKSQYRSNWGVVSDAKHRNLKS